MSSTRLIIKCGEKLTSLNATPGDYEDWIATGLGWSPDSYRVVSVYQDDELPPPEQFEAIVITGSGAMVTDRSKWIEESATWLRSAVELDTPILGICFGHQLLAYALGGLVADNPTGVEVGTVPIELKSAATRDELFSVMPPSFLAQLSHLQSVITLPEGATLLASSQMASVQAFSYRSRCWGIQFHPEFDQEIVSHFIAFNHQELSAQGEQVTALQNSTAPTPESFHLLGRFAEIIQKR
ncbi:hypothetical protein BOW53_10295 [Solemya pervernicosa gill symbiont]|uniref:Glutamine amidotransferase domain-containing protein n=2 Tax=Gammaproteobacteria incertae sedis TaxID=118884 RepID=A0A1T2L498_9GAMM|nr:glutamine amidotransferase [Candidatus Reidiella endopervernicosa]OOZ39756.1 hypothetical protein BOW53_10295 [Solemya pervernicosa gill symbiont]QKQ27911.1 glutamine amidotransferase [Candidatus Reidiella endopervernicosa]